MPDSKNSKKIVDNFFATFSNGDVDRIMDALTDDASWWVSGTIEGMSGTNSKQQLGNLLRAVVPLYKDGGLKITPTSMIAEGKMVAAEATSYAELTNGKVYNNFCHFVGKLHTGFCGYSSRLFDHRRSKD